MKVTTAKRDPRGSVGGSSEKAYHFVSYSTGEPHTDTFIECLEYVFARTSIPK
jgi:hypothetical protein